MNNNGFSKKKALVVALTAIALTVVLGTTIFFAMRSDKSGAKDIASEIGETFTVAEEAELDERINKAIDEYIADFSKQKFFSEVMTSEDKSALGKDIISELSKEMSDEELTQMKEILVKLFSDDSTLTITGSAYFTDETKAYIAQNIKAAVHDAITGYSSDGGEHYTELQTTIERIVSESVGNGNVGYTLSQTDLDNIRQSVLSSIGTLKGETGAAGRNGADGKNGIDGKDGKDGIDGKNGENGKDGKDGENGKNGVDGRDGRDGKDGVNGTNGRDGANGQDGRDGKDGYTPVKGTDYFTEKEIESIIETITSQTEKYVDKKEVDATVAITENIQKEVTEVFNEALKKATEEYQVGISNLDSKLTEILNSLKSYVDTETSSLSKETEDKITALEDSQATFELVNNSDGTYTLKITDPRNQ